MALPFWFHRSVPCIFCLNGNNVTVHVERWFAFEPTDLEQSLAWKICGYCLPRCGKIFPRGHICPFISHVCHTLPKALWNVDFQSTISRGSSFLGVGHLEVSWNGGTPGTPGTIIHPLPSSADRPSARRLRVDPGLLVGSWTCWNIYSSVPKKA